MGYRTKTGNIDINSVSWGNKINWDKRYLIELYVPTGEYNVYTTNDVYRGQFGTYSNPVFAGSSNYLYYQDNILKNNGVATTQVTSLLAQPNSHICTAINTNELITVENITADKIKSGETILGITGTYTGSAMKEYTSETDMNNDIANISDGEVVKVVESGTTSYFIKETISGTATMTKLVKESETMSPQEYNTANDIADEILGE